MKELTDRFKIMLVKGKKICTFHVGADAVSHIIDSLKSSAGSEFEIEGDLAALSPCFTCFGNLPQEIRARIWRMSFEPRLVPFAGLPNQPVGRKDKVKAKTKELVVRMVGTKYHTTPSVLLVNKESFAEATRFYERLSLWPADNRPFTFEHSPFIIRPLTMPPKRVYPKLRPSERVLHLRKAITEHRKQHGIKPFNFGWVNFETDFIFYGTMDCRCKLPGNSCVCVKNKDFSIQFPVNDPGKIPNVAFSRSLWLSVIRKAVFEALHGHDINPFTDLPGIKKIYVVWEQDEDPVIWQRENEHLYGYTRYFLMLQYPDFADYNAIDMRIVKPILSKEKATNGMLLGWQDMAEDLLNPDLEGI